MILKNNEPFLSDSIKIDLSKNRSIEVTYKKAKDGLLIPFINNSALHSTYYPLNEGKRINTPDNENKFCIAIGLGGGYHLAELANSKSKILCVPVKKDITANILNNIDISRSFDPSIMKIINIEEIIEYFDLFKYDGYYFVIHPVLERLYPDAVINIIRSIKAKINDLLLEANTQRKFGKLWFLNILKNIVHHKNNMFDFTPLTIKSKPILVTGSGPSLMNNINIIKNVRSKIFIAATDTSFKILLKNNINPDIIFSFDAQNYSYLHFTGINSKIRIFTDFTTSLKLPFSQTLLFSNHPLRSVFKDCGWNIISLSSRSRNIGGAMIDFFSTYFPDHPVITSGIDYGVFDHYLYSKGSYIDEYKFNNCNYFLNGEFIDSSLFYKYKYIDNSGNWRTFDLFKSYASGSSESKKIYTLSSSPFTPFKKLKNIDEIIDNTKSSLNKQLDFGSNRILPDVILETLKKAVLKDPGILNSYFLSKRTYPDENELKNIIKIIDRYIKK